MAPKVQLMCTKCLNILKPGRLCSKHGNNYLTVVGDESSSESDVVKASSSKSKGEANKSSLKTKKSGEKSQKGHKGKHLKYVSSSTSSSEEISEESESSESEESSSEETVKKKSGGKKSTTGKSRKGHKKDRKHHHKSQHKENLSDDSSSEDEKHSRESKHKSSKDKKREPIDVGKASVEAVEVGGQKSIGKPSKSLEISWCFDCHVGSHWTRSCEPKRRMPSLVPQISWQESMLPVLQFQLKRAEKPTNATQFMNHLWQLCVSIENYSQMIRDRDAVLKRASQDDNILTLIWVSKKKRSAGQNDYEIVCAKANNKAATLVRLLGDEIRDLFNKMIRVKVFPDVERKDWHFRQRRDEAMNCCMWIHNHKANLKIDEALIQDFRSNLDKHTLEYNKEMELLAQDWRNSLVRDLLRNLPDDESRHRLRLRNMPVEEFRINLSSDTAKSWLPMLTGLIVKTAELEDMMAIYDALDDQMGDDHAVTDPTEDVLDDTVMAGTSDANLQAKMEGHERLSMFRPFQHAKVEYQMAVKEAELAAKAADASKRKVAKLKERLHVVRDAELAKVGTDIALFPYDRSEASLKKTADRRSKLFNNSEDSYDTLEHGTLSGLFNETDFLDPDQTTLQSTSGYNDQDVEIDYSMTIPSPLQSKDEEEELVEESEAELVD